MSRKVPGWEICEELDFIKALRNAKNPWEAPRKDHISKLAREETNYHSS